MHVVIDAALLGERHGTGLATYTLNMLKSLATVDSRNRYTIYSMRLEPGKLGIVSDNFRIKGMPDLLKFLPFRYSWMFWYYTGFPPQLLADKPDVFLSSYPSLPVCCPCPTIAVVYDLTPLVLASAYSVRFRLLFKNQLEHAVRCADRIITISHSSKASIAAMFKLRPEQIYIIYPGYDADIFKPLGDPHMVETAMWKYNIGGNYILYVGTLEPKKNLSRLIDAFASLKREGKIVHKLVIAGKRTWGDNAVFQAVSRSGLEGEVIFTGYVLQEELPLLMSGADVFVFPSLHEGFGIPPLEAMACGTPVITSNVASLPEVVGDAGVLVNPYSVDEIAEAINKVVSDGKLREQMRGKGLERAKLFSWEKAGQETLKVLDAAYCSQRAHTTA